MPETGPPWTCWVNKVDLIQGDVVILLTQVDEIFEERGHVLDMGQPAANRYVALAMAALTSGKRVQVSADQVMGGAWLLRGLALLGD